MTDWAIKMVDIIKEAQQKLAWNLPNGFLPSASPSPAPPSPPTATTSLQLGPALPLNPFDEFRALEYELQALRAWEKAQKIRASSMLDMFGKDDPRVEEQYQLHLKAEQAIKEHSKRLRVMRKLRKQQMEPPAQ